MGSKERILKKRKDVSDSIINAAMDILKSEGVDGISIRKIASRIEYSPPVIYSYYRDKEELTDHLIGIGFSQLRQQISNGESNSTEPLFQLEDMLLNYIDFAINNKSLYLLMSRKAIERVTADAEEFAIFFKAQIGRLIPIKKDSCEVDQIYRAVISLVHGMICVCYVSREYSISERKHAMRVMISGFFG